MRIELKWTDLAEDCFPGELMPGEYNEARNARIKEKVMNRIEHEKGGRGRARRIVRVLPLVAVLAVLLTVTAYAAGLYKFNLDPVKKGESVQDTWIERKEDGTIEYEQTMRYDDAGMVMSFEGDTQPHLIRFKAGWLPSEPDTESLASPEEDGWYTYLGDTASLEGGRDIPYVISPVYCHPGFQLVIQGKAELIREGELAGYRLTEVHADVSEYLTPQNFVLLFDEAEGYLISIVGSDSFEDLEHIARELTVDITDEIAEYNPDFNIGILQAGRG